MAIKLKTAVITINSNNETKKLILAVELTGVKVKNKRFFIWQVDENEKSFKFDNSMAYQYSIKEETIKQIFTIVKTGQIPEFLAFNGMMSVSKVYKDIFRFGVQKLNSEQLYIVYTFIVNFIRNNQ